VLEFLFGAPVMQKTDFTFSPGALKYRIKKTGLAIHD